MKKIRIGIAGLGTVGSGVIKILTESRERILKKTNFDLEIKAALDLRYKEKLDFIPEGCLATDDVESFFNVDFDVVVEVIGGIGFARELIEKAIGLKKDVVTANKALLAHHGDSLVRFSQEAGVQIKFEAAVGGAIPIIQTIEHSLPQNTIEKIDGILNGTSNYILTRMHEEKLAYTEILPEAQRLGYAEADPSFDVDGVDAAHKIAILANLAYGSFIPFDQVQIHGIRDLDILDIEMAERMGYVIKPLGITKMNQGKIEARVHPTMLPRKHPLASVRLEDNGIFYSTNFSGPGALFGKGAGSLPTGSAIVADILQIANMEQPYRTFQTEKTIEVADRSQIQSRFYIRLMTMDRPGVLSKISGILGKNNISIASVVQLESEDKFVPLTMMTHLSVAANIDNALKEMEQLSEVQGKAILLHVEA